jgi:lysophospholipase L1-like esterase
MAAIQLPRANGLGETWSLPLTTYGHPIVGPAGVVLSSDNTPGIDVDHDQTGSPAWSTAISAGVEGAEPVFDASGELYFATYSTDPSTSTPEPQLEAVGATGVLWARTLSEPSGCQADGIALGFNGDLYVSLGCGLGGGNSQPRLVALDPEKGTTVFDQPLPSPFSDVGTEIEAYTSGLIAFDGTYLAYLNYKGAVTASFAVPNLPSGSQIAAWGTDGSTYFIEGYVCTANQSVTLERFLPSGPSWIYTWPSAGDCNGSDQEQASVAALPDGSVAINIGSDGLSWDGVTLLGSGASAGTASIKWSVDVGQSLFAFAGVHQVLADVNGNVAAQLTYADIGSSSTCTTIDNCQAYEIDLLNGTSGAVKSTADVHTETPAIYALGTDFDLDTGVAVLGGAVGSQLTMFGMTLASAGPAYPEADRPTVLPPTPGRYVAFGDSVPYGHGLANPGKNSQQGLPPDMPPSSLAYPTLVAKDLGLSMDLRSAGCILAGDNLAVSGAPSNPNSWTSRDVDCHYPSGTPVPIHKAVDPDELAAANLAGNPPSLVTIQVGADDIDFAGCAAYLLGVRFPLTSIIDSTQCVQTVHGSYQLTSRVASELGSLVTGLSEIVKTIEIEAPKARIVVINYYQGVPTAQEPVVGTSALCRILRTEDHGKRTGMKAEANFLLAQLNGAIATVTSTDPDVTVVDLSKVFDGHEICVANPRSPRQSNSWLFDGTFDGAWDAFHPTAAGQAAIASAIEATLK